MLCGSSDLAFSRHELLSLREWRSRHVSIRKFELSQECSKFQGKGWMGGEMWWKGKEIGKEFACLLFKVTTALQTTFCYWAACLQEKLSFLLFCLALRIKHHDLTFHQRFIRNSADHKAHCSLVICIQQWLSLNTWWGAGGLFWHVTVSAGLTYNEWRLCFIRILSAPQQLSQSICKELLQMSPCKLTTYFGRKLEVAKTIQEPGWEMVINFFFCLCWKGKQSYLFQHSRIRGIMTHFKNVIYLMQQSWYMVLWNASGLPHSSLLSFLCSCYFKSVLRDMSHPLMHFWRRHIHD